MQTTPATECPCNGLGAYRSTNDGLVICRCAAPKAKPRKAAAPRDWKCNECGRRMTMKAAERAMFGENGCCGCGGADIEFVEAV